jgi:hypothetical protein
MIKRRIEIIVSALIITACIAGLAKPADIMVSASVDTSRDIYAGDNFTYQIILDGSDQPGEVDLSPLSTFKPRNGGGGNNSSTSISIVNGRTTTNVVKRYVMNYVLIAGPAGIMRIPAVTVTINGKQYQTNEIVMTVVKPGTTDQLELEVTLSQEKCYAGQPVILTVKFYVYSNIGDYQFDIPALSSDAFYVEDNEATKQYRVNRKDR